MAATVICQTAPRSPGAIPVRLDFVEQPAGMKQRRFRGRSAMVPDIDLDAYRFRAVIDVLKIQISLGQPTQYRWVREVIEPILAPSTFYVTALNTDVGYVSNEFEIRINDPKSAATIHNATQALFARFGGCNAAVIELETSIDIYPKDADEIARLRMLMLVQRTISPTWDVFRDPNRRPRSFNGCQTKLIVGGKSRNRDLTAWVHPEGHRAPSTEATVYLGAEADPKLMRIMDKITDKRDNAAGTATDLPPDERRVRVEIRLRHPDLYDLGVLEVSDLRTFRFTRLQGKIFKFMLPAVVANERHAPDLRSVVLNYQRQSDLQIFSLSGTVGLMARTEARKAIAAAAPVLPKTGCRSTSRQRRMKPESVTPFVAFREMNRKVSDALRHLDEREGTAWKAFPSTTR